MTSTHKTVVFLLSAIISFTADPCRLQAVEPDDPHVRFSAEEQAARQKILNSQRWKQVKEKFDAWLSVQTAYSPAQVKQRKAELQRRIAAMRASALKQFLNEMDERLDVLMSPELSQARNWVNQYYTEKAQQRMAKKLGVEEPIKMTASQLRAALGRFEQQRNSQRSAQDAFNRSRESQVKALGSYRKQQQAALEKARAQAARNARRSTSFGSHYAPRRAKQPQTYSPAYRRSRYSIGPWGGVWIGR